MKNATTNGSSTDHRASGKYNKTNTSNNPNSKPNGPEANACIINKFDEQVLLLALQGGTALDQYNIVGCPAGHEHEIDISPFIEKLREAGHNIVQHAEVWKGDCPILGKGRAMNMTRVYSYVHTNGSAAND